jgi:periplasmic protein CpxP/Spy
MALSQLIPKWHDPVGRNSKFSKLRALYKTLPGRKTAETPGSYSPLRGGIALDLMKEHAMEVDTSAAQQRPEDESPRRCGFGRRHGTHRGGLLLLILVALVAGLAGGYVGRSFAQGFGHFRGPTGFGGADAAKVDEHVEWMVRHFAVEVDATPEQKDKLTAIAKRAAKDLIPLREKLDAARKQALGLIGAASVDRGAIEALRVEHMRLADAASKRVAEALADAADVLTPEQRQKIAAHMQQRAERFQRWHRG